MNSALLILGNQLFPASYYKKLKINKVFMAEDYGLCTHYKYHKHKIILFLSAMRQYRDELRGSGVNVDYYDADHNLFRKSFEEKLKDFLQKNPSIEKLVTFDIEDQFFERRMKKVCNAENVDLEFRSSPLFLSTKKDFAVYMKGRKKPFMKTFYEWQRTRFNILVKSNGKPLGDKWSFDQDNRKKLPKDLELPHLPVIKKSQRVLEVCEVVEKNFSTHPGDVGNFWLPTNRKQSLKWLDGFIKHRLYKFGDYQDAMTDRSNFVFHSVISPMLNIGLIVPKEVIERVVSAYEKDPGTIPINSVEGFVRQVIGWREFVRGVYQTYAKVQWETNFWRHERKLKSCWYDGSTGIPILDTCIAKANHFAYNHHIERLMVISNLMLLCEVHPHQVYAWFMEMNADSSDWVMGPNVFGMGQFSDGGIFATKPYICGSNYYLKMSNFKKGDWCHTVDGLYWRFIDKHKVFYKKNPRMAVMVKNLQKMDPARKKMIFAQANQFIEKSTRL